LITAWASVLWDAAALVAAPTRLTVFVGLAGVLLRVGHAALELRMTDLIGFAILVARTTTRWRFGDAGALNAATVAPTIPIVAALVCTGVVLLRTRVECPFAAVTVGGPRVSARYR
jgi:hypothetical protein